MTVTVAILCGMPGERDTLAHAFSGYGNIQIFSGTDRLNLPRLVPTTVKRLVDMGLCGGLGPPWKVADVVSATTLRRRSGINDWRSQWMAEAIKTAASKITIHPVPYFSDGLFDESNTIQQRAAIYNAYPEKPEVMSDETRFGEALALSRGIEFGVVRSLSDDWTMTLPPAATGKILGTTGDPNLLYLMASIGQNPRQIPSLFSLEQDYIASLNSLEIAARAVVPVIANV